MARNLIGTGADQVSVNGMLGELAFQSKENVNFTGGTGKLSKLDIDAISAQLGVTATDIFVYDTSKDSDGGAWRKRCQHTSWYNEQLGTSTRGTRKEFPSIAIIVATSSSVIIYDGDDATLPMWMTFLTSTGGWNNILIPLAGQSNAITAVAACNGTIALSTTNNTIGLVCIRFISDNTHIYCTASYGGIDALGLSQRNSAGHTFAAGSSASNLPGLIGNYLTDVSMAVLASAQIDNTTGLPSPTIAVSTTNGLTFIHDDGTATSRAEDMAEMDTVSVAFTGNGSEYIYQHGWGGNLHDLRTVIVSDGNIKSTYKISYARNQYASYESVTADFWFWPYAQTQAVIYSAPLLGSVTNMTAGNRIMNKAASGGQYGLTIRDDKEKNSCYITTKYNSGWLNRSIMGAWLSDTVSETVTNTELVVNGDFSSSSGWTLGSGWSISGGVATSSSAAHGSNLQRTDAAFFAGQSYIITFNVTAYTSGSLTLYANYSTGSTELIKSVAVNATGLYSFTWNAVSSGTGFSIQADSVSLGMCNLSVDNVSIRRADADRSVNTKGLLYSGTITKTPVAARADLVSYSGFSASNYLYQPYNSGLNFGTGNFSVSGWFYRSGTFVGRTLVYWGDDTETTGRWLIAGGSNDSDINFYVCTGATWSGAAGATGVILDNTWTHFTAVRNGSALALYINGKLVANSTGGAASIASTSGVLRVGYRTTTYPGPLSGGISLLRVSSMIQTQEQIMKIYNDEKVLFQENAKATLYGTYDSINAIGYDDETKLLHVGTSSGRSVFQGLRRIDNTTTAVSASISASNGLVAEQ